MLKNAENAGMNAHVALNNAYKYNSSNVRIGGFDILNIPTTFLCQ